MPGSSSPSAVSYDLTASRARWRIASIVSGGWTASIFASGPASAVVLLHQASKEGTRSGTLTSSTSASRRPQLGGVAERERARDAGRRDGRAQLLAHGVEHDAQPRVALARPPHRHGEAPAWAQDAPDLPGRLGGVEREHQPLAAEHDVERGVGLGDALEVELAGGDVADAARGGAPGGDRRHLRGDVGEHDLAVGPDLLGGGHAEPSRPAGQLEDPLAGPQRCTVEHASGERGRARVDKVRMLAPAVGHGAPHRVQAGGQVIRCLCHVMNTLAHVQPCQRC